MATAAVVAAAICFGSAAPARIAAPHAGGVYRVAFQGGLSFTDGFDPTGEYEPFSWAIESNLMIRTLVGYNHVSGPAGEVLVPDLATTVPTPSDGGRTYTFRLKSGVRFGPPVSREITARDVLLCVRADRPAAGRRRVRLLLRADRRLRRLCARQGEGHLGDPDAR